MIRRTTVPEPSRAVLAATFALLVALSAGEASARTQANPTPAAPAAAEASAAPDSQAAANAATAVPARESAAPATAITSPATESAPAPEVLETRGIDEESQSLKKDALDLNRELFMLEEELLFPANTQVAVYVSMDVGEFFAIDSVQLRVDDKEVANHLYTQREAEALLKGGVHRVYLGNLKVGAHELVAIFTGKGPQQREYRRGATIRFDKAVGAKYLELKITDRARRAQPEFEIKDWE